MTVLTHMNKRNNKGEANSSVSSENINGMTCYDCGYFNFNTLIKNTYIKNYIQSAHVVDSQRSQNITNHLGCKFAEGNEVVLVSTLMGNDLSICDLNETASDAMVLHKVNVHGKASDKCEECDVDSIARAR